MNVEEYEEKYSFVKWLFNKSRATTLPGLDGIPVYTVIKFFIDEIRKGALVIQAKAVAFTFFLSLFPYIITMFTLIPYIPIEGMQAFVLKVLHQFMPEQVYNLLDHTIIEILGRKKGGLLSIGLFLTIWLSTNGMMAVMDCFDRAANVPRKRKGWHQRLVAFQLTVIVFLLLILSIALIVAGNWLIKLLLDNLHILNTFNILLFSTLEWIILILLFFTAISSIYYLAPSYKQKWSITSVGSTMATFLVIIISIVFQKFVNNFGRFNEFYGSLGAVVAMLLFIYLNSFALLIGFELNVSIKNAKEKELEEKLKLPV
jgi:membrane protein